MKSKSTSLLRYLMFDLSQISDVMPVNQCEYEYSERAERMLADLKNALPPESAETLDALDDAYWDIVIEECDDYFEKGFYLGFFLGAKGKRVLDETLKCGE